MEEKTYHRLTGGQRCWFWVKTCLDWLAALLSVVLLSPLLLGVAIAIKAEDRGPVLFKQKRIGLHGKPFSMYKFRTMKMDAPHNMPTHLLKNPEQYITKTGKFLRKTSLDELPQLFNILCGVRLSVVGPRPALWNQDDLIAGRERCGVHQVRPGITGWAQIHGRDELEIDEKVRLDAEYVRRFGFAIDVRCFFGTFLAVFRQDGVVEGGTGALQDKKAKEE